MGISDREDFHGRIADRINLANEQTVGTKEMITALSEGNIKAYLIGINEKKKAIATKKDKEDNRPDFSDLLDL